MSRSFACRAGVAVIVAGTTLACGGGRPPAPTPQVAPTASTLDRMTIRTGEQAVVVDSPVVMGRRIERMIQDAGGYIERSSGSTDGNVRVEGRVPAAQLDSLMSGIAALGKERRRYMTGSDVTDQYTDLEARLRSTVALRDRLQQLLARAATLNEVLDLEKQIARLQSEIDALQARLDQLKSRVELASLAVSLEPKRVLGPLAVAGRGVAHVVSWLFVIR
jgi:predicted RNase H-like nuclease (RuvC/YqgF family)